MKGCVESGRVPGRCVEGGRMCEESEGVEGVQGGRVCGEWEGM